MNLDRIALTPKQQENVRALLAQRQTIEEKIGLIVQTILDCRGAEGDYNLNMEQGAMTLVKKGGGDAVQHSK